MNRERAKELVGKQHLIAAIAEGKVIQHNIPTLSKKSNWIDIDNPSLNADTEIYRVKPEPRVFWINPNIAQGIYFTDEEYNEPGFIKHNYIKVVEDLSDD